jgi:UrcA family protein
MKNSIFEPSTRLLAFAGAVAIGVSGFVVAQPAIANERPVVVVASPDIVTRRISYADLNLASSPGEATLNSRVGRGIKSLCLEATGGDDRSFLTNIARMKCSKTAWDQADPQIERAVQRARDIALTGASPIAAVALTIDLSK